MTAPQIATTTDREHLTELLVSLRPDWDRWLISAVLQSHAHGLDLADVLVAATRWAKDQNARTPKGIFWRGQHWHGLDTKPAEQVDHHAPRCTTCGKPEPRCITERPGPDDHPFEVRV